MINFILFFPVTAPALSPIGAYVSLTASDGLYLVRDYKAQTAEDASCYVLTVAFDRAIYHILIQHVIEFTHSEYILFSQVPVNHKLTSLPHCQLVLHL